MRRLFPGRSAAGAACAAQSAARASRSWEEADAPWASRWTPVGRDRPLVPPGDVVRIDERDGRAPRFGAPLFAVPLGEFAGDVRVHAPALTGRGVGRGEDASVGSA